LPEPNNHLSFATFSNAIDCLRAIKCLKGKRVDIRQHQSFVSFFRLQTDLVRHDKQSISTLSKIKETMMRKDLQFRNAIERRKKGKPSKVFIPPSCEEFKVCPIMETAIVSKA